MPPLASSAAHIEDLPYLDLDEYAQSPYPVIRRLHEQGPLARSERGVEVLDYALASMLLKDRRLRPPSTEDYLAKGASDLLAEFVRHGDLLFMPEERHHTVRKIFAKGFAVRRLELHRPAIEALAERLLAAIIPTGRADMVSQYTERFASMSLCTILGVPTEEVDGFVDAAMDLRYIAAHEIGPHLDLLDTCLATLRSYVTPMLEERRTTPREDFLTSLIEAERSEGRITPDELIWGTVNLLLAGTDTTNFQLASSLHAFAKHDIWDRLADEPDRLSVALNEAARMVPVPAMLGRVALEDVEIAGVSIPTGQTIKLNLLAAGRDPRVFPDPDSFRLDRGERFAILFGVGSHSCIGAPLASMELEIGARTALDRLTSVQLDGEVEMLSWRDTFAGVGKLPMTFAERR